MPLKAALKRGALVVAATWPLVAVQFVTESMLKLLLAVPTIGGLFLVMLLVETDIDNVLAGSLRDIAGTIFHALRGIRRIPVLRIGLRPRALRRVRVDLYREGGHRLVAGGRRSLGGQYRAAAGAARGGHGG